MEEEWGGVGWGELEVGDGDTSVRSKINEVRICFELRNKGFVSLLISKQFEKKSGVPAPQIGRSFPLPSPSPTTNRPSPSHLQLLHRPETLRSFNMLDFRLHPLFQQRNGIRRFRNYRFLIHFLIVLLAD